MIYLLCYSFPFITIMRGTYCSHTYRSRLQGDGALKLMLCALHALHFCRGGFIAFGQLSLYALMCRDLCEEHKFAFFFMLADNGSEVAGVPAHLSDIFAFIACYFIKQCLLLFNNMTLNVVGLLRRHFLSKQSASSV